MMSSLSFNLKASRIFIYGRRSDRERKMHLEFSGNIHTSNLIGLFKIKHMISCIPIRVLLIYDGILQYSFGFGLYNPQAGTS